MAQCKLVLFTFILLTGIQYSWNEDVKGHMNKLGSHREPFGVTMSGKFSRPPVLYGHFVEPSKPLWMRSALDTVDHPGLTKWNDTFFRKNYGDVEVKVETGKKENRERKPMRLPFRALLSRYKREDIYMVHTLGAKMAELVLVPPSLQCGGFQRVIQEAVMWLGSGDAKSVLHYDELDNLLCVLDGRKDVFLIDKAYKEDVEADGFVHPGEYSLVDVDKVDLEKFPHLARVPWHEVHLTKGDCLFIPTGWYHQVTSSSFRHLAINLWFAHLYWFDLDNCSLNQDLYKPLESITTFGFASPNEVHRSKLLGKLHDKGPMMLFVFVDVLDTSTKERRTQFFHAVDRYKDHVLSWSELYGFDIDKAIIKFPDIFGLPGGSSTSTDEDVVLYDPLPTDDDSEEELDKAEDEDSRVLEKQETSDLHIENVPEMEESETADSDFESLPSPDDAVGESFQTEPENSRCDSSSQPDTCESENKGNGQTVQQSLSSPDEYSKTTLPKKDEL